jgi:uncharacterized RDD family membrane protein YckC
MALDALQEEVMESQPLTRQAWVLARPAAELAGVSFGPRFLAYIVDVFLLNVINLCFSIVGGAIAGVYLAAAGDLPRILHPPPGWWDWVAGTLLMTLYFGIYEWLYGATPAKKIMKICVVGGDGEPCGLIPAFVRGILRLVDGLFFGLIAYALMKPPLFQRLGDKAANTVVTGAHNPGIRRMRSVWGFVAATGLYAIVVIAYACFATLLAYHAG